MDLEENLKIKFEAISTGNFALYHYRLRNIQLRKKYLKLHAFLMC